MVWLLFRQWGRGIAPRVSQSCILEWNMVHHGIMMRHVYTWKHILGVGVDPIINFAFGCKVKSCWDWNL